MNTGRVVDSLQGTAAEVTVHAHIMRRIVFFKHLLLMHKKGSNWCNTVHMDGDVIQEYHKNRNFYKDKCEAYLYFGRCCSPIFELDDPMIILDRFTYVFREFLDQLYLATHTHRDARRDVRRTIHYKDFTNSNKSHLNYWHPFTFQKPHGNGSDVVENISARSTDHFSSHQNEQVHGSGGLKSGFTAKSTEPSLKSSFLSPDTKKTPPQPSAKAGSVVSGTISTFSHHSSSNREQPAEQQNLVPISIHNSKNPQIEINGLIVASYVRLPEVHFELNYNICLTSALSTIIKVLLQLCRLLSAKDKNRDLSLISKVDSQLHEFSRFLLDQYNDLAHEIVHHEINSLFET